MNLEDTDSYLDRVKFIAFDFCGTLADLSPSTSDVLGAFLKDTYSLTVPKKSISSVVESVLAEITYSSVGIKTEKSRQEYFIEFNTRVLSDLGCTPTKSLELYSFFNNQDRHWKLKPEVFALLETLRSRSYHLVVASNFDSNLDLILKRNGIDNFFENLFVSGALGFEKPSDEFYVSIPKSLGCLPQEIVMIGDDLLLDVYPSLDAGFKSIFLNDSSLNLAVEVPRRQDFTKINSLSELLGLLPGEKV